MLLRTVFLACLGILNLEFSYAGFTFTLWQVFVATFIFALIGWIIGRLLNIHGM